MTPDPGDLDRVVRAALEEDLRYGPDVTTAAVIPPGTKSAADVVARQPGTLAGPPRSGGRGGRRVPGRHVHPASP